MIKFMLIVIAAIWIGMFLFPPIMKMVRNSRSKKGSTKDEDIKS